MNPDTYHPAGSQQGPHSAHMAQEPASATSLQTPQNPLGSCPGQSCPSASLDVTGKQGKYRRNQSSEDPCDMPKPPS